MLLLYRTITSLSGGLLSLILSWRTKQGKEDQNRLHERKGQPQAPRPPGALIWIHAASVGEAQSALILIQEITIADPDLQFLVTSGTKTSAALMSKRLPSNAIHQYYPLDHPRWVEKFLNHWNPDLVLWMESELWPNMLSSIKSKNIPAILINARLSDRSFKRWKLFKSDIQDILSSFYLILAQTEKDKMRFETLGASKIIVTDNLKYSAAPLPYKKDDLSALQMAIAERPIWLSASTHDGEETMAARIHTDLAEKYPDLLTIIVPRHPERREDIDRSLKIMGLSTMLRGENKSLPNDNTEIYIADTLGELGLFYTLSPVAVIGRSFSHDGGGGHNPIEAAQLGCAVLTGPHVQNQTQLFDEMFAAHAAHQAVSEQKLYDRLDLYLSDQKALNKAIINAKNFADSKDNIIQDVMDQILPHLPTPDRQVA